MSADFIRTVVALIENASLLMLGVLAFCYARERLGDGLVSEVVQGLIGSVLVFAAMYSPLPIGPGLQLDSRNSIVVIITLFGGALAGAITAVSAAVYRLWLGGVGAVPGAAGIVACFAVALGSRAWTRSRGGRVRHLHLLALGVIAAAFVLIAVAWGGRTLGVDLVGHALLPTIIIVPVSMLLFGTIALRFERARSLERRVEEDEARFRAIVDTLPDTLSVRDRTNRFVLINREYERRYGVDAAGVLGRPASEVWDAVGLTRILEQSTQSVWETGETARTPPLAVKHGNNQAWVVCTTFPIRNARGEIDAVGTLTSDVTEVVAARGALQARDSTLVRHQHALTEMLRNAGTALPFVDEAKPILEIAADALDIDKITMWEIDVAADRANCINEWHRATRRHAPGTGARLSDFQQLLADLEHDRVLPIDDALADQRLAKRWDYFRESGIRSCLVAAAYIGPTMQAFLTFSRTGTGRAWTAEDVTFVQSVASVVSLMRLSHQHRDALAALDLVTNGIVVEREDGRVIYANRPALALAGLGDGSAWATNASGLTARLFPRPAEPLRRERDLHPLEWTADGDTKYLEIHRSRLPDGGAVSVIVDITGRLAGQRERQRLRAQLEQASRMEAIGQLAGGIAHDFNNLLSAISGFADFLAQDLPPRSEPQMFARRILSASERGKALVDQILTFTRVRALERSPIDLREVIARSREILTGPMPSAIHVAFTLTDEPVPVLGNEEQISQLLLNLSLNARDAMSERSGTIEVALDVLAPASPDYDRAFVLGVLDRERRYARISVSDTGEGIAPEVVPRIFEPFFTTKERGRGTGLGLAIVHGIIVSHEGACAVDSVPGEGTTFMVYLPISTASAADPATPSGGRDVRGHERVLVVDDEVDITDVLSIGLERLGYEVAAVNSSQEALEAFIEDPDAWDVVVTDHLMPEMHGLDLAHKIKAIRADTVVVVCTGLNDGVVAAAAQRSGIAFAAKPASAATIAACIRDARGPAA